MESYIIIKFLTSKTLCLLLLTAVISTAYAEDKITKADDSSKNCVRLTML